MSTSKPKVRFNPIVLLNVIPVVTNGVRELSLEVIEVKDEHSPGGVKITPEEALQIAHKIMDKIADPLVKLIASGLY